MGNKNFGGINLVGVKILDPSKSLDFQQLSYFQYFGLGYAKKYVNIG